jgi:hypothetical protein
MKVKECLNSKTNFINKVLFFDGHASHISLDLIHLAIDSKITLICLPPHTSSFLQPLDVGVFKSVKAMWRSLLRDYFLKSRFKNVDKENFCDLFSFLAKGAFLQKNALMGFEKCGLFPLNRGMIDESVFLVGMIYENEELDNNGENVMPIATEPLTPKTPKTPKRKSVDCLENTLKKLKHGVEHAVMQHLKSTTPKTKKRANGKLASSINGAVLTDSDVMNEMLALENDKREAVVAKENKKKEQLEAKENRQREKENKKEITASKKALGKKRVNKKSAEIEKKSCSLCDKTFANNSSNKKNLWRRCEFSNSCKNWCCDSCLPEELLNQEFICEECEN